uniref:Uperin-3.5 n=1 Tax=Uperoleia mjobergii TaxID=104954 RepID=UPE35_UPEMJ|nr:RecName: Full=Uperin-3.5 [Uperoleia mjobergii]6GS3_A Chain A, Uperin-3.5 [Uperoleia mjobergii]6GS3_B Chain B, Uperin-3.5 [Uperoleia mjobergii]
GVGDLIRKAVSVIKNIV